MWIFSYPSVLTYVLGAQKNRLIETLLLGTHNICFGWEIRKLNFRYALLTKVLEDWSDLINVRLIRVCSQHKGNFVVFHVYTLAQMSANLHHFPCNIFRCMIPRSPGKRAYLKIIFLISRSKHTLWVLKRTIPKHMFKLSAKKIV